jgi:hypothetical protein
MLHYGDAVPHEGLRYSPNKKNNQKFSNLIEGKTKTNINTSNLLLKLTNYDSNLIQQLEEDKRRLNMADI